MKSTICLKNLILGLLVIAACMGDASPVWADRVDELSKQLKARDGHIRAQAAQALGEIGSKKAVDPLVTALKDEEWHLRYWAAWALGKTKDRKAIEPLIATLKDEKYLVRKVAAWALGNIGTPAVKPLSSALIDGSSSREVTLSGYPKPVAQALGNIGTPAVEPLITALKDKNSAVRYWAAYALGRTNDPRAVEPLITALKENDPLHLRPTAAYALGSIKDPRAVEPLIIALDDKRLHVRQEAAYALGNIKDPRAVELLNTILKDKDWWITEKLVGVPLLLRPLLRLIGRIHGVRFALMLGDIDISRVNTTSYHFWCPKSSGLKFSIELVGVRWRYEQEFEPDLEFSITIKEGADIIRKEQFCKDVIETSNSHDPNISVYARSIAPLKPGKKLKRGKCYELIVDVTKPDSTYRDCKSRLFIDYYY